MKLAPAKWKLVGYGEDGAAIVRTNVCTNWKCAECRGMNQVAPMLERNAAGFRVCPKCGASYGV